jgi:hypothetical protein
MLRSGTRIVLIGLAGIFGGVTLGGAIATVESLLQGGTSSGALIATAAATTPQAAPAAEQGARPAQPTPATSAPAAAEQPAAAPASAAAPAPAVLPPGAASPVIVKTEAEMIPTRTKVLIKKRRGTYRVYTRSSGGTRVGVGSGGADVSVRAPYASVYVNGASGRVRAPYADVSW